jgi:SET domain-containing protein
MELSPGLYVDAKTKGGWSRLINHSCEPNCELQRWNVAGLLRIGIFAIRDIAQHESLSYDYQVSTTTIAV